MKRYSVITEWDKRQDNLNPDKVRKYPRFKGNIEVLAINRQVAELAVLADHVGLGEIVKEISADDPVSQSMMPDIKYPYMCGSKNLIPN